MTDPIEEDDEKMDELLMLQSMAEAPTEPASIEEKWEERMLLNKVAEIIARQLEMKEDQRP